MSVRLHRMERRYFQNLIFRTGYRQSAVFLAWEFPTIDKFSCACHESTSMEWKRFGATGKNKVAPDAQSLAEILNTLGGCSKLASGEGAPS